MTVAGLPAVLLPSDDDYEPIPGVPGHRDVTGLAFDPLNPNEETPFKFHDRANDWVAAKGYKQINASLSWRTCNRFGDRCASTYVAWKAGWIYF